MTRGPVEFRQPLSGVGVALGIDAGRALEPLAGSLRLTICQQRIGVGIAKPRHPRLTGAAAQLSSFQGANGCPGLAEIAPST